LQNLFGDIGDELSGQITICNFSNCLRRGSAFSIGDGAQDEPEGTRTFLYGPTEAYFDKSWQLPDIELLK